VTTFTKTVKLRLREPNAGKMERIEEAMDQSLKCANHAVKRLPSIKNVNVKNRSKTVYNIVKDLKNNSISLNSACAQQAVEKARQSYLSKVMNGNFDTIPKFKNKFVGLHNRDNIDDFFKKYGTYYVTLKLFPYEKITLPFFHGDYQDFFLDKIVNGEINHGSAEVKKYEDYYSLNITVKKEIDLKYDIETYVGVDLGLNVLAWAVALDENKGFLNEIHFDGKEAGHIRRRYQKLRDSLNENGNLKKEKEIGDKEQRWMENKNHIMSRRIVDFADQFDNPVIILENINLREMRKRVDNSLIHSWRAGDLRDMIIYKANEKEIRTHEINPRNTSRECPKCVHTSGKNREGIDFECEECGYTNHADFVGAWNIANS